VAPGERDRDSCDSADPDTLDEPIGWNETEKKNGRSG